MLRPASLAPIFVLAAAVSFAACAPKRVTLPSGSGSPSPNFSDALTEARSRCGDTQPLEGEIGLSGRVGSQRMRGKVQFGLVPGAVRLEGVPPIGSPVFILVASEGRGTLLLPRDRRVLRDTPPEEILDALIGVKLGPDDLRALVTGCGKADVQAVGGQTYGNGDWLGIDLGSGGMLFLQRAAPRWRIAGARYSGLELTYGRFSGDIPHEVHLAGQGIDLTLGLNQIEPNRELAREQLVGLNIPADVAPISLQELRDAGPLGER